MSDKSDSPRTDVIDTADAPEGTVWEDVLARARELKRELAEARAERDAAISLNHRVSVCAKHTADIVDGECVICELAAERDAHNATANNLGKALTRSEKARAECERLREDAERLNWIERHAALFHNGNMICSDPTLRAAIDAARKP